jgi:hypothetical protein
LVEYLGQADHPNKKGYISKSAPKIMNKSGLNSKWLDLMPGDLVEKFGFAVGSELRLIDYKKHRFEGYSLKDWTDKLFRYYNYIVITCF